VVCDLERRAATHEADAADISTGDLDAAVRHHELLARANALRDAANYWRAVDIKESE
jgi:hypothetical protein